jgi:hypothetical protein
MLCGLRISAGLKRTPQDEDQKSGTSTTLPTNTDEPIPPTPSAIQVKTEPVNPRPLTRANGHAEVFIFDYTFMSFMHLVVKYVI